MISSVMEAMMNLIFSIVLGVLFVMLAGAALAGDQQDCDQLRGKGAGPSGLPPYQVELKIFDCAGLTQDIAELDALDRDMMVERAKRLPLNELREQQTLTKPPRKYSELTSASRLARLKQLVDAYYKP